jgi:hypothetical protein
MDQNHWDELPDEVLVLAYRGSGKTYLMMAAAAAFFVNIPHFSACVYAGTKKKSQDFYNGILSHVASLISRMDPGSRPRAIHKSQEGLQYDFGVDDEGNPDIRWILAFSTVGMVCASPFCFFFPPPLSFFLFFIFSLRTKSVATDKKKRCRRFYFFILRNLCIFGSSIDVTRRRRKMMKKMMMRRSPSRRRRG